MREFYKRRFKRIARPYYVALLIFFLLSFTPFDVPFLRHQNIIQEQLRELSVIGLGRFPIHNPALWSIGVEVRWYFIAPAMIALYRKSPRIFYTVGLACYALNSATGVLDIGTLPSFMLGIIAANWNRVPMAGYFAVMFTVIGVALQRPPEDISYVDPIWHLAAFFVVIAARDWFVSELPALRVTGLASYSIYLFHYPIVAWLFKSGKTPPLAIACLSLLAGFAFYAVVEKGASSTNYCVVMLGRLFPQSKAASRGAAA